MPFATRGNVVWLGMILSGVALGFYVLASWPDTSPQVIRLPYGEVMPKTPRADAPAQKVDVVVVPAPATPDAELTVAEPASEQERVPAGPTPVEEAPAPEESAYELGAEPLPGMGPSKPKPAAPKQAAVAPAPAQAPAAEPATPAEESQPAAPEEPPLVEIIIGSAPPSGQE